VCARVEQWLITMPTSTIADAELMHADAYSYFEFWRRLLMYYPYNQTVISHYEYWYVVSSDFADLVNRLRLEDEETKPLENQNE
jgi:hypothetical protein